EAGDQLLPAVIGMRGADDDLDMGICGPQSLDGLQAVPTRWHAHVDEGNAVRLPILDRALNQRQRLGALLRGVHPEGGRCFEVRRPSTDRCSLGAAQMLVRLPAPKDLTDVLVDRPVVVDDQDARRVMSAHGGMLATMPWADRLPPPRRRAGPWPVPAEHAGCG